MSAEAYYDAGSVQDEIASFGSLAFDAIRHQSKRIKELEAELEAKDRELDEADALIAALRNEVGRR